MDGTPAIGFLVLGIFAAPEGDTGIWDVVAQNNPFALALLGVAGIPAVIVLAKWLFGFQQKFTNYYIEENDKLRSRVELLEQEGIEKDDLIRQLKDQIGVQKLEIDGHTRELARQERTIERLEKKLDGRREP